MGAICIFFHGGGGVRLTTFKQQMSKGESSQVGEKKTRWGNVFGHLCFGRCEFPHPKLSQGSVR